MRHDVFISYAAENADQASCIANYLGRKGIRCWIDKSGIRFTKKYDEEIERAIERSCALVWVASRDSIASDYVRSEILHASARGKKIGPVYLEPVVPSTFPPPLDVKLANVQGIQLFQGAVNDGLAKLAADLSLVIRSYRRRRIGRAVALFAFVSALLGFGLNGLYLRPPVPQSIPSVVDSLPAADVLKLAYQAAPPAAIGWVARPELQLAILAKRAGESEFTPLNDGDGLRSQVDDYLIVVRPFTSGYLYVFQVDSLGKVDWLYPQNQASPFSSGENPVAAGHIIQVPSARSDRVLYLDTTTGAEHVYTVFSATRWPQLEDALSKQPSTAPSQSMQVAARVEGRIGLQLRGVGGTRINSASVNAADALMSERTQQGKTYKLVVTGATFFASGSFVTVERWFRHVDR